jgi:hypothetical protein
MMPQKLSLDSDAMVGVKETLDDVLQETLEQMIEREMDEGTVTMKITMKIGQKPIDQKNYVTVPRITTKIASKFSSGYDVKMDAPGGMVLYRDRNGETLLGSNQIEMEDLETFGVVKIG